MSSIVGLVPLLGALLLSPTSQAGFEKIPFHYSSDQHIRPEARFVSVDVPPEELVADLRAWVRIRGGKVVSVRKEKAPKAPVVAEKGQACWEANSSRARQEWATYARNDFAAWGRIPPVQACSEIEFKRSPLGAEVSLFTAELDERTYTAAQTQLTLHTVLRVWLWADGNQTRAYLTASPADGKNEAKPNLQIGWIWWTAAWGGHEASVVRQVKRSIDDSDRLLPRHPIEAMDLRRLSRNTLRPDEQSTSFGPNLCCCDISLPQKTLRFTAEQLTSLGVSLPPAYRSGKVLPSHVHAPPEICEQKLHASCSSNTECIRSYGETGAAIASEVARTRNADEEVVETVAASGEAIVQILMLGEQLRASRKANSKRISSPGVPAGGAGRALTCDSGSSRPAFAGWCADGSFYGPLHVGSLGFYSHADRDVHALAQIGLASVVDQDFQGAAQVGVFYGATRGDFHGLLQAGILNETWHSFHGLGQVGFGNSAGVMDGLLQAGVVNTTGRSRLLQVGLYSDAWTGRGLQVGALYSRGHTMNGLSVGAVTFHADTSGLALGALVNIAEESKGLSFGGVVNATGDQRGIGLGVVNLGKDTRGLQFGLVNVADDLSGVQIGLINIVKGRKMPLMPILNIGFGS